MPYRDTGTLLGHMLAHSREALAMASGRTLDDLYHDRPFELALTRLVEIIGEAASRIERQEQSKFPSIPWAEVISMRNRLIHGYDSVDLDILWAIVSRDLPPLIAALENALGDPTAP